MTTTGRCPKHPRQGGWTDPKRGTSTERGYGWAWRKLRDRIMERDCGLCQTCKREGVIRMGSAVDHIVPKARGGTDDESNLECICEDHHRAKSAREAHGY